MLHLALVALLAGSLSMGDLTGDGDKKKGDQNQKDSTIESILISPSEGVAEEKAIINDTYAFGRSAAIPIKFWAHYGLAEVDEHFARDGRIEPIHSPYPSPLTQNISIRSQRVAVGAQLNAITLPLFSIGVGAQLLAGQNRATIGAPATGAPAVLPGELDSGFGLMNVKFFGAIRGRALGIHGGYILDLGNEPTFGQAPNELPFDVPTNLALTSRQNAVFFGADFDFPSPVIRLFGGVDYFMPLERAGETFINPVTGRAETGTLVAGSDLLVFNMGLGFRISWIELGAAALLRTNLDRRGRAVVDADPAAPRAGHQGSVSPYLRLSPPFLPVSVFVKGALMDEYADYGYAIGGGNDVVSRRGFTAGLTLGF
jgi:hypothetical protein